MATQDARIGAWSLIVTAGVPCTLTQTWTDADGPFPLTGSTVTITIGDVEYTGVIAGNTATFALPAFTAADKGGRMDLRLDDATMSVGTLYVDPRGTDQGTLDVSVSVTPLAFNVQVGGPPGATSSVTLVEDPPGSGLYELVVG